jgi:MATE family multidrug resistance protein
MGCAFLGTDDDSRFLLFPFRNPTAILPMSGETRPILKLALPLIIGQLGQMLLGVADTVIVARAGVLDVAALAFSNVLFHVPLVFGIGVLTCISVRTANARGANDPAAARAACLNGLWLSLGLGLVLFALMAALTPKLEWFGQPAEVTRRAPAFYLIIMASLVPALASIGLKNHADAMNRPWPPFWIFLGGVALNVVLAIVLVFGKLGFPVLGLEGAGWATLIARWAMVIAMLFWLRGSRSLSNWVPERWFARPEIAALKHLLVIGLPASLQMLCEVGAFTTAGLLVGRFGTDALASHQIALTCAATAFMVPLGLSMALTVRIGEAYGAGEFSRLRPIALSGWALAFAFTFLSGGTFLLAGEPLARLFVTDPGVIHLSASLLMIVGVFQIFDGIQVVSASMLRGLHDVRLPALFGFVSYWLVGLPVAAGLAFAGHLGPRGVWWGLASGLAVAALVLTPRLWKKTARKPLP